MTTSSNRRRSLSGSLSAREFHRRQWLERESAPQALIDFLVKFVTKVPGEGYQPRALGIGTTGIDPMELYQPMIEVSTGSLDREGLAQRMRELFS